MSTSYIFIVTMCFLLHTAFSRSPIIELDDYFDEKDPYYWLSRKGIQNLNSTDCDRTCGDKRRVCVYEFVLEYYQSMGSACGDCYRGVLEDCLHPQCIPGDGTEKGVMSINRRRIGPDIQVCYGDILVVNVKNMMGGTESTIHWHGILQKGTQWMDGVPKVTQCPIPEASSFRYVFPVYDVGTYFYHSHTGLHITNGITGALIVRYNPMWNVGILENVEDLREHVMIITDYMHDTAETFYPGLPTRPRGIGSYSYLINGLGNWINATTNRNTGTPMATFHVNKGSSYRFRVINSCSLTCPVQFQIEDHSMTIVSLDGADIAPTIVTAFVTLPGERVDFILNANRISKSYWIHVTGLLSCSDPEGVFINQLGVLSYDTKSTNLGIHPRRSPPTKSNPLPYVTTINHPLCNGSRINPCIADLRGTNDLLGVDTMIVNVNDDDVHRIKLDFGMYQWTPTTLHGTAQSPNTDYIAYHQVNRNAISSSIINNISNIFPNEVSMYRRGYIPNSCNATSKPAHCPAKDFCNCVHAITVPGRRVIEVILRDVTSSSALRHPFHLHGYKFYVMETAQENETLKMTGVQSPNGIPPKKDTLMIPQGGYARIRFFSDNPGDWLIHCHSSWHLETGMAVILRVEGQIPRAPLNFPVCGSFDPLNL